MSLAMLPLSIYKADKTREKLWSLSQPHFRAPHRPAEPPPGREPHLPPPILPGNDVAQGLEHGPEPDAQSGATARAQGPGPAGCLREPLTARGSRVQPGGPSQDDRTQITQASGQPDE